MRKFLLALLVTSLALVPAAFADEEAAVREANAGFYEALNAMFTGDLEPMKAVWSHSDSVTYMGPDGSFEIGWPAVLADWEKQAAMKLGGTVKPDQVVVTLGSELAVVHNFEIGQNKDADGKPLEVSIRATNIYRKENGVWKMVGHHTDRLSFIE